MSEVIAVVTFELNNQDLLNDWKDMSAMISADIAGAEGFISRDSAQGEDGKVYCILKWASVAHQEAFMAALEARDEWAKMMEDFGKIVNLETMTTEILQVV
ncbi:MAG: hypothetical protein HOM11_12035 [Methylococcales bacterium]|nr:hypothetical protein [Methylococcales bacterium]MBT7443724.1 hypothetical protein [Methylococcales bacterium]